MTARLRVLALVTNIPGPLAARTLARDGAAVTKVEPPQGDPLGAAAPGWYAQITEGLEVLRLDLKEPAALERMRTLLAGADVLITAMRAGALERLSLGWERLRERYPRLCHIAIVGEAAPNDDRAGHDLTYQAQAGLVDPPAMPRSVFADMFAAERAAAAAYRALLERERTGQGAYAQIAIADGAAQLADALRYGLTTRDGPLGGALPVYRLYETADGWIAIAALEPHFQAKLRDALGLQTLDTAALCARFAERSSAQWEELARQFDLPLCAVAKV
ncbi:MAG TPA: CoA transferase [Candidatus Baltobacteraceae bacterium]|nr:CoA transferase [Candidatus Baltobacteraceae bacterium]